MFIYDALTTIIKYNTGLIRPWSPSYSVEGCHFYAVVSVRYEIFYHPMKRRAASCRFSHVIVAVYPYDIPQGYTINGMKGYTWPENLNIKLVTRHRRGHGFESRSSLNFFQAFFSQLLKLHSNCEDLSSIWSFIRSSNMCFIYLHSYKHHCYELSWHTLFQECFWNRSKTRSTCFTGSKTTRLLLVVLNPDKTLLLFF